MVALGLRRKFKGPSSAAEGCANTSQKGFGEGDNEKNTQEKIEEWFEQFGKINAVRRRRGDLEGKGDKGKGKGEFKVCLLS